MKDLNQIPLIGNWMPTNQSAQAVGINDQGIASHTNSNDAAEKSEGLKKP